MQPAPFLALDLLFIAISIYLISKWRKIYSKELEQIHGPNKESLLWMFVAGALQLIFIIQIFYNALVDFFFLGVVFFMFVLINLLVVYGYAQVYRAYKLSKK